MGEFDVGRFEGEVVPSSEDVRKALDILRQAKRVPARGDIFDESSLDQEESPPGDPNSLLDRIIQNPGRVLGSMQMSHEQKKKARSIGAYAPLTTLIYHKLQDPLGSPMAGAIAGLLSGWAAKFLIK